MTIKRFFLNVLITLFNVVGFLCNVIYFNFSPFDFFFYILFCTYFRFLKNIVLRRCPQFHQIAKGIEKVKQPWPGGTRGK